MPERTPTPLRSFRALAQGYLPRLFQVRGWILAALATLPVVLTLVLQTLMSHREGPPALSQELFHGSLVRFILPIMAIVAAPAGILEDLEQRTLPLLLTRPTPAWLLPLGKGLIWFAWGALWLGMASLGFTLLGAGIDTVFRMGLALTAAYWAQQAFLSLLGLHFRRGIFWGALYLFLWEPVVRMFPGQLQRLTLLHYIESIAGPPATQASLSSQASITTPWYLSLVVLGAFGLICWMLCGWRLQRTPVGLAGRDAEG